MPEPIDGIRYVHAAIVAECGSIEQAAHDASTTADAAALAEQIAFLGRIVVAHTHSEEVALFPKIVERQPNFADGYLFDHQDERDLFAELDALAASCAAGDSAALDRFKRQTVALAEHSATHVRKENELVVPLCRELFSVDEQAAMVQAMLATFPPEIMAIAVPWIISKIDADTGAQYLGELAAVMPPPVFDGTKAAVRDAVGADHWSALVDRQPALA